MSWLHKIACFLALVIGMFACDSPEPISDDTIVILKMPGTFSELLDYSDSSEIADKIKKYFKNYQKDTNTYFDSHERLTNDQVYNFYKNRNFKHAWLDSFLSDSLMNILELSEAHGLSPDDYGFAEHIKRKKSIIDSEKDLESISEFDIELTQAILRYSNHLLYGKTDPQSVHWSWNIPPKNPEIENYTLLDRNINSNKLTPFIKAVSPLNPAYKSLSNNLGKYASINSKGGWEELSFLNDEQTKIEPDNTDPLVLELRRRLFAEGYIDSSELKRTDSLYSGETVNAVKEFQVLHGLNNDGVIGKRTLASFNVSCEERLDQIILNLERLRWIDGNLKGDYILVNVAQYQLYANLHGNETWNTHVIVGKNTTKTPMFTADMKYVVFNPVWTLPYSIASRETLPQLKKDSLYLEKNNMILLDYDRNEVSPKGIDWQQYTDKNFPYIVRQMPGNNNSLGRIKFLFPNDHYIYLHDTPSRNLFRTDGRSYSHGCVRVNNPKELAQLILNDSIHWNMDSIQSTLDSMKTVTVTLEKTFPVYIVYLSAFSDQKGSAMFFEDTYKFDAILKDSYGEDLWVKKD